MDKAVNKYQQARDIFNSEMNRARSLLDAVDLSTEKAPEENLTLASLRLPRSVQPLGLDQIQGRLPGKTSLL